MVKKKDYDELLHAFITYDMAIIRSACRRFNVNARANDGETILITAISFFHDIAVEALLERGADVNMPDALGKTPLMWAAIYNNTEAIELLLSVLNLKKDAKDPDGWNALDFARCHCSHDAIEILTEAGLITFGGT